MKLLKSIERKINYSNGSTIFNKLSNELRNDREVVLLASEKGVIDRIHIKSTVFRNDRQIVLNFVRHNGNALQFASNELKYDREIVLEAIRNDGYALKYASKVLRQDRELILESIKTFPDHLEFAPDELLSNREFILECVKMNGLCFEYLGYASHHYQYYQSDIEIIKEAIKQNPFCIYFMDMTTTLMNDSYKTTILNSVDRMHLKYIHSLNLTSEYIEVVQNIQDLDIALKLIETIPFSIHFLNAKYRSPSNNNNNYKELIYKSTLLTNGYWMRHSEDAFQQRINHAYYSAKIDSDSEINYYRNLNRENLLWEDLEWNEWEE